VVVPQIEICQLRWTLKRTYSLSHHRIRQSSRCHSYTTQVGKDLKSVHLRRRSLGYRAVGINGRVNDFIKLACSCDYSHGKENCVLCRALCLCRDLDTMINFSAVVNIVISQSSILPWIILGIVPVSVMYFFIQLYYRMSGPDLQRIDAMSRSPIQASLAEGKYILICFQHAILFLMTRT
jgi:hypothetical protein